MYAVTTRMNNAMRKKVIMYLKIEAIAQTLHCSIQVLKARFGSEKDVATCFRTYKDTKPETILRTIFG